MANYKYFWLSSLYSSAACLSLLIMLFAYRVPQAIFGTLVQRIVGLVFAKDALGFTTWAR